MSLLDRLVEVNAPFWSAEAEVVRSYFHSPGRTVKTDRQWLFRQAFKEYADGYLPALKSALTEQGGQGPEARRDRISYLRVAWEEYRHFDLFAHIYESLGGRESGGGEIDIEELMSAGNWRENEDLRLLRQAHKRQHGLVGELAHQFTEGGYCCLYREGMVLRGGDEIDEAIAIACAQVYDDEFGHMLRGLLSLDVSGMDASDLDLLCSLTRAQMRLRILMRQAQFGHPVSPGRLDELLAGHAQPMPFDRQAAANLEPLVPGLP
jgi:hypothetical protein